jgi:ribosomal protein L11 methylase PrmA
VNGDGRDLASWRDPWGFVYRRHGVLLRQVNERAADEWYAFSESALATQLVSCGWLLPWEPAPIEQAADPDRAVAVLRPEPLGFISWPYEWTFGELKAAALLTLDVQLAALEAGFSLRDASAYNVQFRGVTPVLIDHLSFERLPAGKPWVAYRQFCEHFLAPLALTARVDPRLGRMLRDHLEGVPLDLAARLLPTSTRFRLGLGAHIHLHARSMRQNADAGSTAREASLSSTRLRQLVVSLRQTVEGLHWEPSGTEWAEYADVSHESYASGDGKSSAKAALVRGLLGVGDGRVCWDLGANTGVFSAVAAEAGYRVYAFDADLAAAERHFQALSKAGRKETTPLVMDLADPSPSQGWHERERRGLVERGNADVLLGLALIHHLAIGRNVPLPMVLDLFADLASDAIVEWVPREDPMVKRMLASREDVFDDYTEEGFRKAAEARFEILSREPIESSGRVLYALRRRDADVPAPLRSEIVAAAVEG